jgi:hypothetical protein
MGKGKKWIGLVVVWMDVLVRANTDRRMAEFCFIHLARQWIPSLANRRVGVNNSSVDRHKGTGLGFDPKCLRWKLA